MVSNGSNFGVEEAQPKSLSTKSLRVLLYTEIERKEEELSLPGLAIQDNPQEFFHCQWVVMSAPGGCLHLVYVEAKKPSCDSHEHEGLAHSTKIARVHRQLTSEIRKCDFSLQDTTLQAIENVNHKQ